MTDKPPFHVYACNNCGTKEGIACLDRRCCNADERDGCIEIGRLNTYIAELRGSNVPLRNDALASAHAASEAATELLRYSREGGHLHGPFDDSVEVIEKLADALKMAIGIAVAQVPHIDSDTNQLLGALERYLEGWAG